MNTNSPDNTTDARVDANRRNAQHSTGPRSEAGKARSSQNAVRSGWFTRDLRVAEDKVELYLEFEQAWREELQPAGLLELEAFADFLRAAWHKREVIEAQNEANASAPAAFLAAGDNEHDAAAAAARKFDRLHRYERDFERRSNQALRELRRLQTERAAKTNPSDLDAAPPLAAAKVILQKRTQAAAAALLPLNSLPEDLRLNLHIMEIETNHLNALLRARKAGLTTGNTPGAAAA